MATRSTRWALPVIVGALVALGQPGILFAQSITPSEVAETIPDGGSVDIEKTVQTPDIPPEADICFLADTTGSMGPALASVTASIGDIMADVLAESPDAQFCAAQYKDVGSSPVFSLDQALTADTTAVQTAVAAWTASGGGDAAEDQLHALTEMAGASPGWRPAPAAHVLVWFGDCPGHDPASGGETLASTIEALTTSGAGAPVIVLAVSVHSDLGEAFCGPGFLDETLLTGGVAQATEITSATGGVLFADVDEDAVGDAIAAALDAVEIPVEVAMVSDCTSPITTTFNPATQTVNAGEAAVFTETISVSATPDQQGQTYECDDWATINGVVMTDDQGNPILEHKTITVPDTTAPTAACVETTNPGGNNVPRGGGGAGHSGQNPDGFYELLGEDVVDPDVDLFVVDKGADGVFGTPDDTTFGPFASGTRIKYVEANGATPSQSPGPGVIDWKIKGQGDFGIVAVDASGNVSEHQQCHVAPPPK
ncbi:MAG TPA: vWA domain-containing protein [Candidatus Limnocylindria bacterium]|nr:vWA domain-containing protein [Candidatus Limnocylindria bacterium]